MLIDSHCHVLSTEYENPNNVIEECFNSGLGKMFINGFDIESSKEAVALAQKYDNVYAAVGIGPENIDEIDDEKILIIKNLLKYNKVVAIGEIGLDYYWTKETKEKQLYVFEEMLKIAKENKLPVIIHSRDAIQDTYNLVKKYGVTGIMHCYAGSYEMALEFIKLGFLIGVGGVVTFKNAKNIKDIVRKIPLSSISLETDSPYLSPEPFRGKTNIPSNVDIIVAEIANLKGIAKENVILQTGQNISTKFDL